jgi:hypothetical protein
LFLGNLDVYIHPKMSLPSEPRATILSNGVHSVHAAFRDLARDLKATRWARGFGWFGGVVWFLGLVGSLAVIVTGASLFFRSDRMACQADGTFRLDPRTYSMWSSSGFFQITLGWGTLTFAQAKAIDIIWDVVGRPGSNVQFSVLMADRASGVEGSCCWRLSRGVSSRGI